MMNTRNTILIAALDCARDYGYAHMTRDMVATYAGVAPSLVSHHMGTMEELRDAVMNYAILQEDMDVVLQGLASNHPIIKTAPKKVKEKIAARLSNVRF